MTWIYVNAVLLAIVSLSLAYSSGSPSCFGPSALPATFTSTMCSTAVTPGATLEVTDSSGATASEYNACDTYTVVAANAAGVKGVVFSVEDSTGTSVSGLSPSGSQYLMIDGTDCVTHSSPLDATTATAVFAPAASHGEVTLGAVVVVARAAGVGASSCEWSSATVTLPFVEANCTSPPTTTAATTSTTGGTTSGTLETFSGFLTDLYCWNIVVALDGANMKTEPEKHTVHCMRDIQQCIDSGFGVLVGRNSNYDLAARFDANGNRMALDWLRVTDGVDDVQITVSGYMSGPVLQVTAFEATASSSLRLLPSTLVLALVGVAWIAAF